MLNNKTKQKLQEGKTVIGTHVQVNDLYTTEIMGAAGFDFLSIDTQHSPMGPETLNSLIRGLCPTESDIIVRAAWNETWLINHILDLGADGVIVPLIETAEDVRHTVASAKYPPKGIRSWGPRKTDKYGGVSEYYKRSFEEILVLTMIETHGALENIDEILEVDGVDGIMIGPNDLALSHGLPQGIGVPEVDRLIQRTLDKCREHGVPFGMYTITLENTERWVSRGCQIAIVGGDIPFLKESATQAVRDFEEMLSRLKPDA